jgi:probable phosphomutase (TIGR03848 family)
MATLYLIRHGNTDWIGHGVSGWTPGVHLDAAGRVQADRLAQRLRDSGIQRLVASPLERAQETAAPLAKVLGVAVETREQVGEVHFGEWCGKKFAELNRDPEWKLYNRYRSGTRPPGGESMLEVQLRMVAELDRLRREGPGVTTAVVSHGDVIRAALLHFLGMPIDFYARIEVGLASFSIVEWNNSEPKILRVNEQAE